MGRAGHSFYMSDMGHGLTHDPLGYSTYTAYMGILGKRQQIEQFWLKGLTYVTE